MNTVTIDSATYQEAERYAKMHNITIEAVFERSIDLLLGKLRKHRSVSSQESEYYISPKVKALETGFKCPMDLSLDYEKELSEALAEKHL